MTKTKCKRCGGTGTAAHRTARHDAKCFCCGGLGYYERQPARKRATEAERLAQLNEIIVREWPQ